MWPTTIARTAVKEEPASSFYFFYCFKFISTKNINLTFLTSKEMLVDVKTAKITEKGQISIPKEIRRSKGFKNGKKIVILSYENRIEIIPLQTYMKKIYPALMSEKNLAKDWLSKEDEEAWKDL